MTRRAGHGPLVVVGDCLLDRDIVGRASRLSPDAPIPVLEDVVEHERPGGAGLAALLAARDGRDVVLVTALGDDAAGARLRALLADRVNVLDLGLGGPTPEKVRVRSAGQSLVRLDHGCAASRAGAAGPEVDKVLGRAETVLVADYGRGLATGHLRGLLAALAGRVPLVWDPHPRGAAPAPGAWLVTPNLAEVEHFARLLDPASHPVAAPPEPARWGAGRWGAGPAEAGPGDAGPSEGGLLGRTGRAAARLVGGWRVQAVAATMG